LGRVRNKTEEERRRREEEVRAFRAALEKISPRGHVDSEGRMKSREVPSATEGASLQAAGSAAGQSKEKREKEAMTASFFARSDEERRREEEKGRRLWQLIEQLRKDSQARAGAFGLTDEQASKVHSAYKQGKKDYALQSERYRQLQQEANRQLPERVNAYAPQAQDFFGLTDKQASKVHSAYKQGVKDYNLQSEQYRQLIGEANRQVFERGVAYVEQGKEDEKQQQAQIKQAYEKYLPLSEERKASNARREKALTELPQKVIGYMQKEMRKGKDEKYLQEQVMKDVREEGYRGLNALYEAGVRMAQGRENLDQWRHNALMEKEKLLFENPNNEDLIGKEDYEQRVAQGAQFNKFVQGGTDTENIAYGEGWQKSYLTDGSKYLRPEEIDRLSYYLSFSDDPMKKREAQDYYEYLENLGQRRYEYYRFLSGETAKRGGEYGDAFISGGMEDSMQGIVSFLFDKPLSILTDRIAPTHVDTAEQMRYAQDLANETDPIKKLNKQVLQAVGAQVPYMFLGGLTPKMYAGSNIGFKAGKEATEEWAKINAKDLVRMSQAGYYGSMAASIYGNAEQQALLEGKNPQQAATYALLNTMAEVGLQAVVGRVAGIAGGAMMQHSPLAQSFVNRIAKNPIAQRVTVTLLRTGGENVEEALQMALQPALMNMAYGTNEKLNITKEEAGELAYITTGATLLMNVFSLGLNLKNDIVTIRRDLRLPDNTLLSAEIQNKILLANAVDAPLERVLTKGEMAQVQAFAQNMTTEAFAELIEEAKRVAAFRFGNKTYARILQEIQGKPFYEKLQVLSYAIIEYIDEKRQQRWNKDINGIEQGMTDGGMEATGIIERVLEESGEEGDRNGTKQDENMLQGEKTGSIMQTSAYYNDDIDFDELVFSQPLNSEPLGKRDEGTSIGGYWQNKVAVDLAALGCKVLMLDPNGDGKKYGRKKNCSPDYLTEDILPIECYTPLAKTNVKNIVREMAEKTRNQARSIILVTEVYEGDVAELVNAIKRKANPQGDLKDLRNLILYKDGKFINMLRRK
jgi:hypothetical protein